MTKSIDTNNIVYHQFTIDEYYRMAEVGILDADTRVELLDGKIVDMSPIGRFHAACVDRLAKILMVQLANNIIRVQGPVRLDNSSEPEPDLGVLIKKEDFYSSGHPTPKDVLTLIEVADTTLEKDKTIKLDLYAAAAIKEVWIVNVRQQEVLVYDTPDEGRYLNRRTFKDNDKIITHLPLDISVSDVFGTK